MTEMNDRIRLILLNGPPRCGKDTAASYIQNGFGAKRASFADELKRRTHALYGLTDIEPWHFEGVKDKPQPEFLWITPRNAYIGVSELLMKPQHGKAIFGQLLLQRLIDGGPGLYVAPDSGFIEEAHPIVEDLGKENVLLLRIHALGRGCTFQGDSRNYIGLAGVKTFDVHNDGEVEDYLQKVDDIVEAWLRP